MAENKESVIIAFIEDYKRYELLWNLQLKDYSNKIKRFDALEELGKKHGLDIISVKNKIKSLRSYFVKEHEKASKKKSGSVTDDNYVPTWFAYKSLLFLKDTIAVNVETEDSLIATPMDSQSPHSVDDSISTLATNNKSGPNGETDHQRPRKRSKNTDNYREEDAYKFMKSVSLKINERDEFSSFGDFVGHKIRNLNNRRLKSIAQQRITNVLFELEMSSDNERSCTLCSGSSVTSEPIIEIHTPIAISSPDQLSECLENHANDTILTNLDDWRYK